MSGRLTITDGASCCVVTRADGLRAHWSRRVHAPGGQDAPAFQRRSMALWYRSVGTRSSGCRLVRPYARRGIDNPKVAPSPARGRAQRGTLRLSTRAAVRERDMPTVSLFVV